jgi:thiamine kinase-like enzyme
MRTSSGPEGGSAAGSVAAVCARVPELSLFPRRIRRLPGGRGGTYRVTTAAGDYVVRIRSQRQDAVRPSSDREHENSCRAADRGVGAPVVAYLPDLAALVMTFLPGRAFTAESLRNADSPTLHRVASAVRELHGVTGFHGESDMVSVQRYYRGVVAGSSLRLPVGYDDLADRIDALRRALRGQTEPLVACHNDLVPANVLDDGDRVRIIDYEYAGVGEASSDLGYLAAEAGLDRAMLESLVEAYWGRGTRRRVARTWAWGVIARYTSVLWASLETSRSGAPAALWESSVSRWEAAQNELASATFFDEMNHLSARAEPRQQRPGIAADHVRPLDATAPR